MAVRQWWASAGAGILAVAVHGLLLAPFVLGGLTRKHPVLPDQVGAGSSAIVSSAQPSEAMQLIDLLHTEISESSPLEELASRGIELPRAAMVIASADLLPAPVYEEDLRETGETAEAAGDTQGHAVMFGRYIGQISARIERAWVRPRSDIGVARFSCQAKIEQDRRGYVLSVELHNCNGDWRWQRSLAIAIEHASPLPSPPVSSVFANKLVLDFSAGPYTAGVSEESQYEPAIRQAAVTTDAAPGAVASDASEKTDQTLGDAWRNGGHIDLRIEGKTVSWTSRDPAAAGREAM